jgi:hypothetical protein
MLATTSNWSLTAPRTPLAALTSWLLASIQKLATVIPQVDRDAVIVFLGD